MSNTKIYIKNMWDDMAVAKVSYSGKIYYRKIRRNINGEKYIKLLYNVYYI